MESSSTAPIESIALSRELEGFLVRLAAALQRHSMYPAGHPALRPALGEAMDSLSEAMGDLDAVRIKIAPDSLVVGEATTPADQPLLRALARRLHAHQLLSITLIAEVGEVEMSDFLSTVGVEPGISADPLGAGSADELERWPNILIEPVPYEALSLADATDDLEGVDAADTTRFWAQIGSSTGNVDRVDPLGELSLTEIEQVVGGEPSAYDELIEAHLPGLLEAWNGSGENAAAVRQGVSKLILNLEPDQLARLMRMARSSGGLGESTEDGQEFDVSEAAVQELIDAARDVGNQRVPIWLIRVLTKIAMYSESVAESQNHEVHGSLNEVVEQLAVGWNVADAKPVDYEEALGRLVTATPVLEPGRSLLEEPRSERVLQISLEIDDLSRSTRRAAKAMLEEGELAGLLDLLDVAPSTSPVTETLWKLVAHPETVRRLLERKAPDFSSLDRLLPRIGLPAAEPMLEALIQSESRSTRRELLNRLGQLGPEVGPLVLDHIGDDRWYVRRNMLALLDRLPVWPELFTPEPYLSDSEPRVRHEAIRLALKEPALRDQAVLLSLAEEDESTIALGVAAAEGSCPMAAVRDVIRHALDTGHSQGLRVRAVHALFQMRSPETLAAMIRLTWSRRWIFWGKLAPNSPVMLAALAALAETWSTEPAAIRVLARAMRSADPRIRALAGVKEATE